MDELVRKIKSQFEKQSHVAHDFSHAERVAAMARHIAEREAYDTDLAEVAACPSSRKTKATRTYSLLTRYNSRVVTSLAAGMSYDPMLWLKQG